MKQKHLGRVFIILIFLTLNLFANVVDAYLDRSSIYEGEQAKLTISAKGSNIEFPTITLPDAQISGGGSSSELIYINGKLTKKKRQSYIIDTTKDITIPALDVRVDGKVYKTNPLTLKVLKQDTTSAVAPYILNMSLDKNSSKVGEPVELTLTFKIKQGARADRVNIIPPKISDFWVKGQPQKEEHTVGGYDIVKYKYTLFPQKSGVLTIPKTYVSIGIAQNSGGAFDDPFFGNSPFTQLRWRKIYSNSVKLNVEALPNGLELYGHFLISLDVPKKVVKANEPLNITIKVKGEGNFDDIKKFKLNIPGAMVYESEPNVRARVENGKYIGELSQKIAIVADRNYTIPPIKLNYFDSKKQKEVTITTNPVAITVIGTPTPSQNSNNPLPKVEVAPDINSTSSVNNVVYKSSGYKGYLMLLAGFILGVGVMLFINIFRAKKSAKKITLPIAKRVKKAKNDKELYKLLLPYAKDDSFLKDKLELLEQNIYKGAKNSIDKDEIVAYFEQVLDNL